MNNNSNVYTLSPSSVWRKAIITRNKHMEAMLDEAKQVATSDASVLIRGKTGTGKELLARAIHNASARASGPFVAINCTAIPEALLESELFGHCKGAFTGAISIYKGLFQAAHKGTLFLDEIGEMSISFQVKLLRALQEKQVRPVGVATSVSVDVRIISATHIDLEGAIVNGSFREDLYYRMNVVTLELPSLAQRRDDIPLLANHFLAQFTAGSNMKCRQFAAEALELLATAPWPGNIRQLCNVVEQIVALSTCTVLSAQQVRRALRIGNVDILELNAAKRVSEHEYIARMMNIVSGNVSHAARLAGRDHIEFYKLLNKHGLSPALYKTA
jgi:two-component system response regulator GlrR